VSARTAGMSGESIKTRNATKKVRATVVSLPKFERIKLRAGHVGTREIALKRPKFDGG
jgi:hypothetical protein